MLLKNLFFYLAFLHLGYYYLFNVPLFFSLFEKLRKVNRFIRAEKLSPNKPLLKH
jgi:hypothetical protein